MEIVITALVCVCLSTMFTSIILNFINKEKNEEYKAEVRANFEKLYDKKVEKMRIYYNGVLERENEKNKQIVKNVMEGCNKRIEETNESAKREVEVVRMLLTHSRKK